MSEIKTIYLVKPKLNKYRWIAGEKLEKYPPLNDGDVYMVTEPEFVGKFIEHQDIEVLPANPRPIPKLYMREEIGMGVINPRGIHVTVT